MIASERFGADGPEVVFWVILYYTYCTEVVSIMATATPAEVITLAGLANISKGENKYKNNYVLEVKLADMDINAVVRASTGDRSYIVKLTVWHRGDCGQFVRLRQRKMAMQSYGGNCNLCQQNWRIKNGPSKFMDYQTEEGVEGCE